MNSEEDKNWQVGRIVLQDAREKNTAPHRKKILAVFERAYEGAEKKIKLKNIHDPAIGYTALPNLDPFAPLLAHTNARRDWLQTNNGQSILNNLKLLPNITHLDLSECKITDFRWIDTFQDRITALNLSDSAYTLEDLSPIFSKFPKLTQLVVDDFYPAQLNELPESDILTSLSLGGDSIDDLEGGKLGNILAKFPRLNMLRVCSRLLDFKKFPVLKELTALDVGRCEVTQNLSAVREKCPNLIKFEPACIADASYRGFYATHDSYLDSVKLVQNMCKSNDIGINSKFFSPEVPFFDSKTNNPLSTAEN